MDRGLTAAVAPVATVLDALAVPVVAWVTGPQMAGPRALTCVARDFLIVRSLGEVGGLGAMRGWSLGQVDDRPE